MYVLDHFRNVIPPYHPSEPNSIPRLSTFITLFTSYATRAIVNPSNLAFPLISRFLLQRPQFDTNNVPMFFDLLFSHDEDRRWERAWILKFVRDGVKSSQVSCHFNYFKKIIILIIL